MSAPDMLSRVARASLADAIARDRAQGIVRLLNDLAAPSLTDDTVTYWPDVEGVECDITSRYADVPRFMRSQVEWDVERKQFVGRY